MIEHIIRFLLNTCGEMSLLCLVVFAIYLKNMAIHVVVIVVVVVVVMAIHVVVIVVVVVVVVAAAASIDKY